MFIAIEGIDGTGKSTQAARLAAYLESHGKDTLLTKEPGGWEGGEKLREMVLDGSLKHPWSEIYLFMLDRAEHIARVIKPAEAEGRIVVCERYHASTVAYQVYGRGMPEEPLDLLFKLSDFPVPDLTILLDMEPEKSMRRVIGRGNLDAFEREGCGFMQKIREGYLKQMECDRNRWVCISADVAADDVFDKIAAILTQRGVI